MEWDKLTFREKAEYIKTGVKNGLTNIDDIKGAYNKFDKGGYKSETPYSARYLTDAIYNDSRVESLGEPSHHYDFTQSEEWADAHGYYPDGRGHRDDRVKKETHPTHPSRGTWKSPYQFELSDRGMQDSNYILFGLADGGQDPQATLTYNNAIVLPEITVTPQGNYIYNSYDNLNIHKKALGGSLFQKGGPNDILINRTYTPSDNIQDKIAEWEGASMATNRNFKEEAADFNRILSPYIKERASQEALDAMFSQSYNTGYNRWNENVQPHIENFYRGKESLTDIFNTVTVHPKDFKESHRGFRGRRYKEYDEIAKHPYVDSTRVINDNNEYGRIFSVNDDGSTWVRNDDGRVYKSEYLTIPEVTVTARRKKK